MKRLALVLAVGAGCATTGAGGSLEADRAGQQALGSSHPREAYADFERAVKADPANLAAYRHLVDAARAVGRLDALTEAQRRAVALTPTDPLAHYRLGLCLFARTDGEQVGLAELAEAARLAPPRSPDTAELQLRYGSALLEAERPGEALPLLQAAVASNPDDPHPHLPLVLALHRSGRDPDALAEIGRTLLLFPSQADVEAYHRLVDRIVGVSRAIPAAAKPRFEDAMAALDQADTPSRAVDLLEVLVAEQPQLAPAHAALGLAYLKVGDNAQAVYHLRQAIELDPAAPEAYAYLGQIFHDLGREAEAQAQFELAVARNPLFEAAHDQLLQLALARGDGPPATREARLLAGLRVGAPVARLQLAQALKLSGDLAGAEAQLRPLAAPNPDKPKPGTDADRLALADAPTRVAAQIALGTVELEWAKRSKDAVERGRRNTEARKWLEQAVKEQPDNATAVKLLAEMPK